MRLPDGPDAAAGKILPGGSQCGPNLGRVVGVIIYNGDITHRTYHLETTADTAKFRQRLPNHPEINAQFTANGDGCQGVTNIVLAWYPQPGQANNLVPFLNQEIGAA